MIAEIASIGSAVGTIIAGVGLLLTYRQFKRLDKSIQGNTYQALSQGVTDLYQVLLAHPKIDYMFTRDTKSSEDREQQIFLRILGNYLENVWVQLRAGLLDESVSQAFRGLVKLAVAAHPEILDQMKGENFDPQLRAYAESIAAGLERGVGRDTD